MTFTWHVKRAVRIWRFAKRTLKSAWSCGVGETHKLNEPRHAGPFFWRDGFAGVTVGLLLAPYRRSARKSHEDRRGVKKM